MVIRGRQRATHSDVGAVSGRARELEERGFCFLRYHPGGAKPGDVWDILPEDTQGRGLALRPVPGRPLPHPHPRHVPAGRRRARPVLRHGDGDAGRVASWAAAPSASTSPRSTWRSRGSGPRRSEPGARGPACDRSVTSCSIIRRTTTGRSDEEEPAHARRQHQRRGRGAPARARRARRARRAAAASPAGGASRPSRSSRRSCSPSWPSRPRSAATRRRSGTARAPRSTPRPRACAPRATSTQLDGQPDARLQRRHPHRLAAGLRRRRRGACRSSSRDASRPEYKVAFDAWVAIDPLNEPGRPGRPALHAGVRGPAGREGGGAEQGGVARVRPGRRVPRAPARTTCA